MTIREKNIILSNEALDKYHQELESVIKSKSLYLRPNLCLDDLSDETGIPIENVKQVLSEKLNLSFFEFISEYKINEAKRLLTNIREDQFSISAIAIQSGFNTKDSFLTIFEEHTKMSPKEYRIKYFTIDHDSSARLEN